LAATLHRAGETKSAIPHMDRAVSILDKDPKSVAFSGWNIRRNAADLYFFAGEYRKAGEAYIRWLELAERLGVVHDANTAIGIYQFALCFKHLGQPLVAQAWLEQALYIRTKKMGQDAAAQDADPVAQDMMIDLAEVYISANNIDAGYMVYFRLL